MVEIGYLGEGYLIESLRYPDHTTTQFTYDANSKITSITDRLGNRTSLEYDGEGDLTGVVAPNGQRTTIRFDEVSGLEEVIHPDGSVIGREYDEEGKIVRTLANGEETAELEYESGYLTKAMCVDGEQYLLEYGGNGRIVKASCSGGTTRFKWDDAGRPLEEDHEGQTIRFRYDAAGRWTAVTYPGGATVRYSYDAEGRIAAVIDWQGGRHEFTHAADDRKSERKLPNRLREIIEYTETEKRAAVIVQPIAGNGTALFATRYTYDDEERLVTMVDSHFGSRDFSYDAIDRIRSVRGAKRDQNEGFVYDAAENWKTANGETVQCNPANQLVSQGTRRFAYDSRGNMLEAQGPRGTFRYTYNLRNQMIRAEGPGGVVTFAYDALGRRIWKRTPGKSVRYVWADDFLLREIEQEGPRTTTRDYLYWPGSFAPLAVRVNEHIYCFHNDTLGTPRRLTDQHGQIVWLADYTAFGEAKIQMELVRNHVRFPGQQYDEETGLHYNRHRYYSPSLGRYLTRDPLLFADGTNLYSYVQNRPLSMIDPLGLNGTAAKGGLMPVSGAKYDTPTEGAPTEGSTVLKGRIAKNDPSVTPPKQAGAGKAGGGGGGGHDGIKTSGKGNKKADNKKNDDKNTDTDTSPPDPPDPPDPPPHKRQKVQAPKQVKNQKQEPPPKAEPTDKPVRELKSAGDGKPDEDKTGERVALVLGIATTVAIVAVGGPGLPVALIAAFTAGLIEKSIKEADKEIQKTGSADPGKTLTSGLVGGATSVVTAGTGKLLGPIVKDTIGPLLESGLANKYATNVGTEAAEKIAKKMAEPITDQIAEKGTDKLLDKMVGDPLEKGLRQSAGLPAEEEEGAKGGKKE